MAKISLRSYDREISDLIDRGDHAEAIAHCKYILKIYPKHIATYHMLGKAYFEGQRYSEALDLFQRILSVYPDDYVAHLCVSIIREDEENLDAAIFHMERAFEVQPANAAIQEELRRLYGRRDGVVPPRVRLTRGALVRMYERGELYRQAVAEILAALKDDPERLDLLVVLCRVYLKSGQKVEATEIAGRLISKLPYCYEANRALAEIIPTTSRAEEAEVFQQRLIEIDPYQAFVSPAHPNAAQVPDSAVQIDKFDYQGGESTPDTGWVQNLGISLPGSTQEEQTLPDWFQTSQPAEEISPNPQQSEEKSTGDAEIPDFMRQAGFVPASGPEQPPQQPFDLSDSETGEDIASAEIPDWLQSLAPEEQTQPAATTTTDEEWLAGLTRGTEEALSAGKDVTERQATPIEELSIQENVPPLEENETASLPDWLTSQDIPTQPPATSETLPEWLNQPPVMPDRNEMADEGLESDSMPDWMREILPTETTPEPGDIPSALSGSQSDAEITSAEESGWLQEIIPAESQAAEEETTNTDLAMPSEQLSGLDETTSKGEEISSVEEPLGLGEIPDWLQGLAPEGEVTEPTLEITSGAAQPGTNLQDLPDWLNELPTEPPLETSEKVEEEETTPAMPDWISGSAQESTPEAGLESAELPDWLADLQQPIEGEPTSSLIEDESTLEQPPVIDQADTGILEEKTSSEQSLSDVSSSELEPVGLVENIQGEASEEVEIPEQISEPLAEETVDLTEEAQAPTQPVHLKGSEGAVGDVPLPSVSIEAPISHDEGLPIYQEEEQTVSKEELPVIPEEPLSTSEVEEAPSAPVSAAVPAEMPTDLDAALAWMEALAARQGAEEGTLTMNPEDRREEMPEWLQQEVASAQETQVPLPPAEAETTLPVVNLQETEGQAPEHEVIPVDEAGEASEINRTTEYPVEPEAVLPAAAEEILYTSEIEEQPYEPSSVTEQVEETVDLSSVEEVPAKAGESPVTEEQEKALEPEPVVPAWLQGVEEESIPSAQAAPEQLSEEAVLETPLPEVAPIQQPQPTPAASDLLAAGQDALQHGDMDKALSSYEQLIRQGEMVEETIHDLREAIDRYPMEIPLYQLLGDAYMRANHLQDAIDAYTKAERLLR